MFSSVSLTVAAGEAVGIVGPNGAGKTTLLDLLTGTGRCDAGRVLLEGRDVTGLPPPSRARMGLGRTFQVPEALIGTIRAVNAAGTAIVWVEHVLRDTCDHLVCLLEGRVALAATVADVSRDQVIAAYFGEGRS